MDYWKWLGKGLFYILTFRWVKYLWSPIGEGMGITILLIALGLFILDLPWNILCFVLVFFTFTHGAYRDFVKEEKEEKWLHG